MGATKKEVLEILESEPQETGLTFELKNVFEANKKGIAQVANKIINDVKEGNLDSVKAFINARKGTELFKKLEEGIRPYMEKDANVPSGEIGVTMYHTNLTRSQTGVAYDYASCGDAIWDELNAQITQLSEAKKQREEYLKGIKKEEEAVDEGTGESWKIKPPAKTGRDGIKVQLK